MEDRNNDFENTKLSGLCLKVITSNFDRFMHARVRGDTVPKKHFEFLQRAYGKELFEQLAHTEHLRGNVDFLLNEYLKEVTLTFMPTSSDVDVIFERLKSIGGTVKVLQLFGYSCCSDMLLDLVCHLPNVESLILLDMPPVTDDVLRNIGQYCSALKSLILEGCINISDAGIAAFCSVKHKNLSLTYLDVSHTHITTFGITFVLKHCPNIIRLRHYDVVTAIYDIYTNVRNNCVKRTEPYKLTELVFRYSNISLDIDFFVMCPVLCPNVTKLTVSVASQFQIDVCARFTKLKAVYFFFAFRSANFSSFVEACGGTLQILRINNGVISIESLFKACRKLTWLELKHVRFELLKKEAEYKLHKHKFHCLKLLSFDGMLLEQNSIKVILSSSPNLKNLYLYHMNPLDDFINSIMEYECMRTLRDVNVSHSYIKLSTTGKLVRATPNLRVCSIQHCGVAREDLGRLRSLRPSLKFDLDNDDWSD